MPTAEHVLGLSVTYLSFAALALIVVYHFLDLDLDTPTLVHKKQQ